MLRLGVSASTTVLFLSISTQNAADPKPRRTRGGGLMFFDIEILQRGGRKCLPTY